MAALSASETESSVGGCGPCDKSTVSVSLAPGLESVILSCSCPVIPGSGSDRLAATSGPFTVYASGDGIPTLVALRAG
ncbi:hypothetical protein D9M73_110280 [compost metagenome]